MASENLLLAYLQILITLLVFGIGLLPLVDDKPHWLRQIFNKYSNFNFFRTIIVVILTTSTSLIIVFLSTLNSLGSQTPFCLLHAFYFGISTKPNYLYMINCFFANNPRLLFGILTTFNIFNVILLYYYTSRYNTDYLIDLMINKSNSASSTTALQILNDLTIIGKNTEDSETIFKLLKSIRAITETIFSNTSDNNPNYSKIIIDYTKMTGESILVTLADIQIKDSRYYILSLRIIRDILKYINKGNMRQRPEAIKANIIAAKYYQEIIIALLSVVEDRNLFEILRYYVIEKISKFKITQDMLLDIVFQSALVILQRRNAAWLELLDYLRNICIQKEFVCHAYWGLLARIAGTNESAKAWVKNTELGRAEYTPEEIDAARDYFIFMYADFETADALQQLKEHLFPPTDDSSTSTSSW